MSASRRCAAHCPRVARSTRNAPHSSNPSHEARPSAGLLCHPHRRPPCHVCASDPDEPPYTHRWWCERWRLSLKSDAFWSRFMRGERLGYRVTSYRGKRSQLVRYATRLSGNDKASEKVDWTRILPFILMHLVCLSVIWVGWSPVAVMTAVAFYVLRMFAITAFYHRYFSHRSFKTSRVGQFVFGVLGASAVQRGPVWWAAHHRHHHAHSDKPADVHSPCSTASSARTWAGSCRRRASRRT